MFFVLFSDFVFWWQTVFYQEYTKAQKHTKAILPNLQFHL